MNIPNKEGPSVYSEDERRRMLDEGLIPKNTRRNKKQSAAILTIFNASEMTPERRQDIAKWLDRQKKVLLTESGNLSKRYTARFLYV